MNIIHYNNIKPTADLPDKVEYFLSAVELASFTQNKQYQITHWTQITFLPKHIWQNKLVVISRLQVNFSNGVDFKPWSH